MERIASRRGKVLLRNGTRLPFLVLLVLLCLGMPALADDLADLSLEDLLQTEVTSVSKRAQKISESPAAITVITNEEIRRSGMTTIPDLLRMVPGLHVANIDANKFAVTARGFNGEFANKLLVMVDGRSVYTPLFSGVYWDVQQVVFADIDRIEVIRGPGGAIRTCKPRTTMSGVTKPTCSRARFRAASTGRSRSAGSEA